jgi:hypothetical protein
VVVVVAVATCQAAAKKKKTWGPILRLLADVKRGMIAVAPNEIEGARFDERNFFYKSARFVSLAFGA